MITYNKDKTELHSLTMKLINHINKGEISYESISEFIYKAYDIGLNSDDL